MYVTFDEDFNLVSGDGPDVALLIEIDTQIFILPAHMGTMQVLDVVADHFDVTRDELDPEGELLFAVNNELGMARTAIKLIDELVSFN